MNHFPTLASERVVLMVYVATRGVNTLLMIDVLMIDVITPRY